tara:strand:- start:813 stop:3896 length:3084 start_codon:yes stop_codon:yes gene_type:complete
LDIKNAHLRVTGNVHTDVLKVGSIGFQPAGSNISGTVNFTNVTTGVTTTSNLNVGGTLNLGTIELSASTHTLDHITARGNVTSTTVQFDNAHTSLVTSGNVEIGGELTVSENVNLLSVSNVASIKKDSNVVTEFPRSKKLIRYPRVALTAASGESSGYQGYYVTESSNAALDLDRTSWKAFNMTFSNTDSDDTWTTDEGTNYNGTGNTYNPSADSPVKNLGTGAVDGEWIKLQLPQKIKLEYMKIWLKDNDPQRIPEDWKLYGSDDNTNWTELFSKTGQIARHENTYNVNATSMYNYLAVVVTKISVQQNYFRIVELEYFGVPEYDPEAHGTDVVVKSVPNVPNTDWLEVYYDAKNYSGNGDVQDETGNNRNGTLDGVTYDSVSESFKFVSGNKITAGPMTSFPSGTNYTASMWFKVSEIVASQKLLFHFGHGDTGESFGLNIQNGNIGLYLWGGSSKYTDDNLYTANDWVHAVGTINGSTAEVYVNGHLRLSWAQDITTTIPTDPFLSLGIHFTGEQSSFYTAGFFTGSIANFRLFNRVLTSDEIYQLYAYQKEYFGHGDLGMTLKAGRLGIGTSEPRAALDVRGDLTVSGESDFNNVGVTGRTTTRRLNEINFAIPPIDVSDYQQFFWLAQFSELQWNYSEYLRFDYNLEYSRGLAQHNRAVTSGGYAIIATRSQGATGTGTQYDNEAPIVRRVEYTAYRGFAEGPHFYYVRNSTRSKGYLVMGFRSTRTGVTAVNSRLTGTIQYNGNLDNIDTFNGTVYKHGTAASTNAVGSHSTLFPSVINDSKFVAQSGDTVTLHQASESTTYFTGQHTTYIEDLPDLTNHENNNGLIVSSNKNDYIHLTNHKIRGKEAITQDESLPITSLSTRQNDKTCFGVMSCKPFDEYTEKRFCVVNSLGEGAIWVVNTNGNLEAGDYITTSNVTGYGQKQDDDILRNYTVAKITMDCNFNPVSRPIKEILRSENGEYILDEDDQIQWTDTNETEMQYNIRYVDANSTLISQDEYTTKLSEGENVYIAAYVGCTYHCG